MMMCFIQIQILPINFITHPTEPKPVCRIENVLCTFLSSTCRLLSMHNWIADLTVKLDEEAMLVLSESSDLLLEVVHIAYINLQPLQNESP